MQKIRCLIVDDEPLAARLIERHLSQFKQFELVASCWNAMDAFEILERENIDLIFLDIQMPVLSGMDFAKSLRHPPRIIFVTAYRDYAAESYELDVVDYLVKPITFDRFFKAINKFLSTENATPSMSIQQDTNMVDAEEAPYIYVNSNRKFIKVLFKEVLYIESLKDYVRIHTSSSTITTKDKISEFEQKVPEHFLRVHRSFIVNTQKITAFTAHDIEIGEKEIPIGVSYKQIVFNYLKP